MRDEFKRRGDERKGRLTEEVGSKEEVVWGEGGAQAALIKRPPPPHFPVPLFSCPLYR